MFLVRTPWKERPIGALKLLQIRDESVLERFKHEAALAIRLEHPNLAKTYDAGMVDGEVYVCSEFVLGKSVEEIDRALKEKDERPPPLIAISLLYDVLAALAYISRARDIDDSPLGLTHRDVSPSNIMVGFDGVARLIDFGVAKSALTDDFPLTAPGLIVGTVRSMAPEVIRGERATHAADIYGLGSSLFKFLAGAAPFEGASINDMLINVVMAKPKSLRHMRPDLPVWLVEMVHMMLDQNPHERPNSDELLLMLKQAAPRPTPSETATWMIELFRAAHESASGLDTKVALPPEEEEEEEDDERTVPDGASSEPETVKFDLRSVVEVDGIPTDANARMPGLEEDEKKTVVGALPNDGLVIEPPVWELVDDLVLDPASTQIPRDSIVEDDEEEEPG